jgi:predicted membrane-bound mannosyltransferase
MSFRPAHVIQPLAKLTAENAASLELSTHRRAVASASAMGQPLASQGGSILPATSTPTSRSEVSLLLPSSSESPTPSVDKAPALSQSTGKRPVSDTGHGRASTPMDDIGDGAPISKRPRTLKPSDTLDEFGMHTDVQVIDIDDASDPREESLNKSNWTADISFFFTPVDTPKGQAVKEVTCDLCT